MNDRLLAVNRGAKEDEMRPTTLTTTCLLVLFLLPAGLQAQQPVAPEREPAAEEPQGAPGEPKRGALKKADKPTLEGMEELSPLIVKKLDARQLERYLRHRETMRAPAHSRSRRGLVEVLVPLFFFLCLAGIVGGALFFRHRQNAQRHQTLRVMIEKGAEIPPELLTPPVRPRSDLRRGVVLVAGGIGVTAFFALVKTGDASGVWSLGLIPTLIGLGYLIVWKIEGSRSVGPGPSARELAPRDLDRELASREWESEEGID
jgi:hypothetical protein